jgi:acetolactate synthase-1/2/3 large subunit
MPEAPAITTGATLLVDALAAYGVQRVFCVPGESYLAVLDALYDRRDAIQTVTCRQEGGAAMMAEADGKLTGRPGICMVTRGPGATNASAGLHVGFQDSTPMILFIGQVGREFLDREAFQEIDYRRMFGQVAKWVAQIDDPARVPEYLARAFATAVSGRPGPVVLALPEDMLTAETDRSPVPPFASFEIFPGPEQMSDMADALRAAERPLMILGGSRWDEPSWRSVQAFAEANDFPVVTSFRRQDRFDNDHPCYAGEIGVAPNPSLRRRVQDSDLLILLGGRLGEMATGGYTLLEAPKPRQKLVHVHAGAEELGRVYQPDISINATPGGFAALLGTIPPIANPRWAEWRRTACSDYQAWQEPRPVPGPIQMAEVVRWMRENLPADSIITNGAGNFATWAHRYYRYRRLGSQLAPTSGSMGYGLPAAVAAKLRHPDRTVICMAGDGDFLMTGQELSTAVQYGANIVVVILDNRMYGTIRMHQERHYPERTHGTDLRNPDFVMLAHSYGAYGERVESTGEFAPALERARGAGTPAVLHLKMDPEAITPTQSLSQIRSAAKHGA